MSKMFVVVGCMVIGFEMGYLLFADNPNIAFALSVVSMNAIVVFLNVTLLTEKGKTK
jgi:hypothetical protein